MNLGCGIYLALIHARANLSRAVVRVPWQSVRWGRVLDDTSAATVQAGDSCCPAIFKQGVRPWSHTLAIYRRVPGVKYTRVWSGPITSIEDDDGLTFEARDLSAWFDRRRIHTDQVHFGADLSTIYQAIWDDAMEPDPVPNFTLQISDSGHLADREVLADQNRIAGDEMRELGRTGLDWTVLDRTHIVQGEEIANPPIATLIDRHFATPPAVSIDGFAQANDWVVSGSGGGAEGDEVVGTASSPFGAEGLLEAVASEPSILDVTSALDAADTRLAQSSMPQVFIREAVLLPDAPVAMANLIPGVQVRFALDGRCLPVRQTERLSSVQVEAGQDGTEKVTIGLQPLGTTAGA